MYQQAKDDLLKGRFSMAGDKFEKLEMEYPFTEEANKAIILATYSYFKAVKYDEVMRLVDYYKKINFDSENLQYMYFLEIMAYIEKIKKYPKDLKTQKQALQKIKQMNLIFSDSKYTDYINKNTDFVLNRIVANELKIVDFYIQNNNVIGALNHLKMIENDFYFKENNYFSEINYRFFEIYRYLNDKNNFLKYYALLKQYGEKTKWYDYATKKL